ncbi:hypothetical protein ABPG77_004506 [Micractinium sp. CCAP 211/92]
MQIVRSRAARVAMLPTFLAALVFCCAALGCAQAAAAPSGGALRLARQLLAAGYQYERTIGGPGREPGQFDGVAGILALPDGTLYVADVYNDRIQKLHENGTVIAVFGNGVQGSGPRQWNQPRDIAMSPDGTELFVLDSGNQRVKVLGLSGTLKFSFGENGHGRGNFLMPVGVATGPSGVYITDTFYPRVQKFDYNGNFLWTMGEQGQEDGQFAFPMGCAVAVNVRLENTVVPEVLYVADQYNSRVQYFDGADGSYLGQFSGTKFGDIAFPAHLDVTADNSIVVVESQTQRFERFSATGAKQLSFDSYGTGSWTPVFDKPTGVSVVSLPGLEAVYVADESLNTIQKFTLGLPSPPPKPPPPRPPRPAPPQRRRRQPRPLRRRSLPAGAASVSSAADTTDYD